MTATDVTRRRPVVRRVFAWLTSGLLTGFMTAGCSPTAETPAGTTPATPAADLVLRNGKIYTARADAPWAEAVAVRDGVLQAVDSNAIVSAYIDDATRVIDLDGALAIPGLIDGHSHPAWGGVMALYFCLFDPTDPPDAVRGALSECIEQAGDDVPVIRGGLWTPVFFENHGIDSPRDWLDALDTDKAIVLEDDSGHNSWLNSHALALVGIDESTPPPSGTVFEQDPETGRLTGMIFESAVVDDALPPWSTEQYRKGAEYAQANANQYGITAFEDASASRDELRAYHATDEASGLTLRVSACLLDDGFQKTPAQAFDINRLRSWRERYRTPRLLTSCVKIFLDGVPTSARTAAMLAPYTRDHGGTETSGLLHVPPDTLADVVSALDQAGFNVKIHAAGDRSVHVALNAIETARQRNGASGLTHELAHAGFVQPSDIPRFRALNVAADLSPYLWFPSPIIDDVNAATGPRGATYWPNRTLLESGAPLLAGSDWPSVAPDMNPWLGIESMITRRHPDGAHPGVAWPAQRLTLDEALQIFTAGGARYLGIHDVAGTLEPGKSADIAVLNQNIFRIEPEAISETRATMTLFEGKIVYQSDAP